MAISVNIYNNANNVTRTVTFDFVGEIIVQADDPSVDPCNQYCFKISTGARQEGNAAFPLRIVKSFDDLVLNNEKQRQVNTNVAYSNVKSMVIDYVYDYVEGHVADEHDSGCTEQLRMKF